MAKVQTVLFAGRSQNTSVDCMHTIIKICIRQQVREC